jgi:hypothetical protein
MSQQDALRLAVLAALKDVIASEEARVRRDGKEAFRDLREAGFRNQEVRMSGGGPVLGLLVLKGGTPDVDVDQAKVLAFVRASDPHSVEDFVDPTVVTRPEVVALLREHLPHLVQQRVKGDVADKLTKQAKRAKGRLLDTETGEFTTVGTPTVSPIVGEVQWRPEADATGRIMAALQNQVIPDLGLWPLALPAAPAEPQPAAARVVRVVPDGPEFTLDGKPAVQVTIDEAIAEAEAERRGVRAA